VHRAREKWVDKVIRKGATVEETRARLEGPFDWERQGFKDTNFLVSIELVVAFDETREGRLSDKYGLKYLKNTHRPSLTGEIAWGREKLDDGRRIPRPSWAYVLGQSFPQVGTAAWLEPKE
jgi:hypothetical protein